MKMKINSAELVLAKFGKNTQLIWDGLSLAWSGFDSPPNKTPFKIKGSQVKGHETKEIKETKEQDTEPALLTDDYDDFHDVNPLLSGLTGYDTLESKEWQPYQGDDNLEGRMEH